jgi:hypothetical protein
MRNVALFAFSVISESGLRLLNLPIGHHKAKGNGCGERGGVIVLYGLKGGGEGDFAQRLGRAEFVAMVSSPLLFSRGPEGFGVLDMAFPSSENLSFQMRVGRNPLPIFQLRKIIFNNIKELY